MHEAFTPDINRHMRGTLALLIEKQQIARSEVTRRDRARIFPQSRGTARQIDAGERIAVLDQTATVETARRVAAVTIGFALHVERVLRGAAADRAGIGLPRRGGAPNQRRR